MKTGEGRAGVSQRGRLEGEREGLRGERGREEDLGSVPSKKRRGRFSSFEKVREVCWEGKT